MFMKKLSVVILAVVYLAVSSGIVISQHFCMNRLDSVQWFAAGTPDECGRCGMSMEEAHGCCHDQVDLVKLQNDQQQAFATLFNFSAPAVLPPAPIDFLLTAFPSQDIYIDNLAHAPPLLPDDDLCILNSVFRI
jgi:hypothetical protein